MVVNTYSPKSFQFLFGPDPAYGVMRAAQKEEFYQRVLSLFLQVFKIHHIAAIFKAQWIVDHTAPIIFYNLKKGIVNRRLHYNFVSRMSKSIDYKAESRYYTWRKNHPIGFHLPVMPPFHPSCYGFKIRVRP